MPVLAAFATLVLSSTLAPSQTACAVTSPNARQIPSSVAARARIGSDFRSMHGNGTVWTYLWPDGTVTFRKGGPGFILRDGSLQMKFLWVLATEGPLSVTGKRLDAIAAPLRAEIAPGFVGAGFQPSSLIFPTEGCWEVTAKANGSELTFVTRVVKLSEGLLRQ